LNRFQQALAGYLAFKQIPAAKSTPEYKDLDYNLAYAYFKLKNYPNAITAFGNYVETKDADTEKLNDAYLRLGDSYFVSSKYWPAIETYNKVIARNIPERDYASLQKALSYGFLDRNTTKIEELSNFRSKYPSSTLNDEALFELANTYVTSNNTEKGLQLYDQLISDYSGSSLVPEAMMRQGLIHYNANRSDQALSKFKAVVRAYPTTQAAIQAVTTAKLVYMDLGQVDEYAKWAQGLDFVEVTDSELETATYESADKQYMEGKTDAAIKGFENYLKQFPNGTNAPRANFNLAQLYFGKGQKDQALPFFKTVAAKPGNEYAEQPLTRVCEIYVGKDDYVAAIPFLEQLEGSAKIRQNITFARSNLMKGYYEQANYNKTMEYAGKVLATSKIDDRIKSDAHIMIARSAIKTNDEDRAQKAYAEVLKIASGELAAEALYYDAYFKNRAQDYEASNASVQKLAKSYAGYKEWSAKGLIIMAKNFYALGDAFQATYILESVVANFEEFPAIVDEAKKESSTIKAKEAQSNSSINSDGN